MMGFGDDYDDDVDDHDDRNGFTLGVVVVWATKVAAKYSKQP